MSNLDEKSVEQFAVSHQPLTEQESQAVEQLSPDQRRMIRNELTKAHRGMGHPNADRFVRILKLGGASAATLGLAKSFRCSQRKANSRPKTWR